MGDCYPVPILTDEDGAQSADPAVRRHRERGIAEALHLNPGEPIQYMQQVS